MCVRFLKQPYFGLYTLVIKFGARLGAVLFTCARSAPRGSDCSRIAKCLAVANLCRDHLATCGILRLSALYEHRLRRFTSARFSRRCQVSKNDTPSARCVYHWRGASAWNRVDIIGEVRAEIIGEVRVCMMRECLTISTSPHQAASFLPKGVGLN